MKKGDYVRFKKEPDGTGINTGYGFGILIDNPCNMYWDILVEKEYGDYRQTEDKITLITYCNIHFDKPITDTVNVFDLIKKNLKGE